jgi:hypothetical protein
VDPDWRDHHRRAAGDQPDDRQWAFSIDQLVENRATVRIAGRLDTPRISRAFAGKLAG